MSDTNEDMDLGLRRSLWLRGLRRIVVLALLLGAFVEVMGLPHVRLLDPERSRWHREPIYWSVTGWARFEGRNTPLLVLIPLRRSLQSYARGVFHDLRVRLEREMQNTQDSGRGE